MARRAPAAAGTGAHGADLNFNAPHSIGPVVLQQVHPPAERIAHEEPAHAPRLVRRPLFDGDAGGTDTGQRFVQVVDLHRQVRHRRP